MNKKVASYEENFKNLGYADTDKPSSISIHPKDFVSKQNVNNALDQYNENMKKWMRIKCSHIQTIWGI